MTLSSHNHRFVRAWLKGAVGVCLLGCLVLALGASGAGAKSNAICWQRVLHDWLVDGRIDGTYPPACLNKAMAHLGTDAQEYSSFADEAKRALQADRRWQQQHPGRKAHYNMNPNGGPSGGGYGPSPPSSPTDPGKSASGPIPSIIDKGTPSDPTSVPVPLLVLGGVAILLLAAGGASYLARRFRGRSA